MILDYWGLARAKAKESGRWVYGTYYKHQETMPSPIGENDNKFIHLIINDSFADWNMPRSLVPYEVIPETICPYIGRNDRNDNKIFVHDVIKPNIYEGEYFEVLLYEEKNTLSWHMGRIANSWNGWEVEIIGNTIDNPYIMGNDPSYSFMDSTEQMIRNGR